MCTADAIDAYGLWNGNRNRISYWMMLCTAATAKVLLYVQAL